MSALQAFIAIAVAFLGGGGIAVAVVNARTEKWKWKKNREAEKEDRQEEKEDLAKEIQEETIRQEQRLDKLEKQIEALVKGQRSIMLDRVIYLGQNYIKHNEITFEERKRLRDMHDVYHHDLGGNGDADLIMAAVDKLDLKK